VSEDTEKTEDPTPERRRKAREEGQFARGKDAGNTVAGIVVLLTLASLGGGMVEQVRWFSARCFGDPYDLVRGDPAALFQAIGAIVAVIVIPVAAAAALGSFALGLAEAGYHPNMDLAAPKFSRLDPLPKLKQMFAFKDIALDIVLQAVRVFIVGAVAYSCVESTFPQLMELSRIDLRRGVSVVVLGLYRLALWSSLALACLSFVDYVKSYRKHEQSIKMSRQELKDEMKQQEGDGRIKQRQRARAREAAKRGLVRAVAASDFIISNPTHISVALRYRVNEGAPVVTAKGYDEVALYIRKLAKDSDIPVIENRPLAKALAKRVKPGRPVPVDLYAAVAEILAFVYRIKKRSLESLTSRGAAPPGRAPERRPARRGGAPAR
jgi:flagellar biosynthesis protein FlhB